jgi:uncharacterized Ntn-hydrolase superfamily protein
MRKAAAILLLLTANTLSATFSIVARDPQTGELGVAVASRFFSVGSVVPYASASAGAVATQANANVTYGPRGLELFADGLTAEEIVKVLLRGDANAASRQVGLVGRDGTSATHTGPECNAWAGGRSGPNYAVQGNILASEQVVIRWRRHSSKQRERSRGACTRRSSQATQPAAIRADGNPHR